MTERIAEARIFHRGRFAAESTRSVALMLASRRLLRHLRRRAPRRAAAMPPVAAKPMAARAPDPS